MPEENKEIEVIEEDTDKKVAFANKAAKVLQDILNQRPKQIIINGKKYVDFEGYQTIASFYGYSVGTEWTKQILAEGKVIGYEAKANVYNKQGIFVSSAESACQRDEKTWQDKPDFQLRSMAQTRACVKALRNVFAWVIVLAGYSPTPHEEIIDVGGKELVESSEPSQTKQELPKKQEAPKGMGTLSPASNICTDCGMEIKSEVIARKSTNEFGVSLCWNINDGGCQEKRRNRKDIAEGSKAEYPEEVV